MEDKKREEKIEELEEIRKELEEISVSKMNEDNKNSDVWKVEDEKENNKPMTLVKRSNSMSYKGFISTVLVCAVSTVVGIMSAAFIMINR